MKTNTVITLALSCATLCVLVIGLGGWAFWRMTSAPASTQNGTRLLYSVDFERGVAQGAITPEEQARSAELMNGILEQLRVRVDPARGVLKRRKLGARFLIIDGHRIAIELPPSESGEEADPETIAKVREMVEARAGLELFIGAEGHPDYVDTDWSQERKRVALWLEENPGASLEDYNALEPEAGGPAGSLRWYPRRVPFGFDASPIDQFTPLLQQTGRERITTDDVYSVKHAQDGMGYPALNIGLRPELEADFGSMTEANLGRICAIVLGGEVVTLATIKSRLPANFIVEGGVGGFTYEEVDALVRLLRSGELALSPEFEGQELIEEPLP